MTSFSTSSLYQCVSHEINLTLGYMLMRWNLWKLMFLWFSNKKTYYSSWKEFQWFFSSTIRTEHLFPWLFLIEESAILEILQTSLGQEERVCLTVLLTEGLVVPNLWFFSHLVVYQLIKYSMWCSFYLKNGILLCGCDSVRQTSIIYNFA